MALVNYPLAPTSETMGLDFNHCDKYDDNDGYFDREGGQNQLSLPLVLVLVFSLVLIRFNSHLILALY